MTAAVLDFATPIPNSRELMERALEPHLLIGMPHLTPHGLSETWLMKELGHRHWLMLARAMGMDDADSGRPTVRKPTQPSAPPRCAMPGLARCPQTPC